MLSEKALHAFFAEVHRSIGKASKLPIAPMGILYPPRQALSEEETAALREISGIPGASSAIGKLFANACASAFFDVFTIMDAVSDPENWEGETWSGIRLSSRDEEDEPMLHDQFWETYRSC